MAHKVLSSWYKSICFHRETVASVERTSPHMTEEERTNFVNYKAKVKEFEQMFLGLLSHANTLIEEYEAIK
jgi:hypothetical protein